jgi:2,4-dienoyl-CoA reductase-like NADH-dependent reductase (Old Yellow Enzyme family)/thioredoxin reductase
MHATLPRLAEGLHVGGVWLKHRLVMGALTDGLSENGRPGQAMIEYYLARARGGAALITIGATEVHPDYQRGRRPALTDEEAIPAFKALTDAVHAAGVPIVAQFQHSGASAKPPVSPSGVPSLSTQSAGILTSRALTLEEVIELRERFIEGAVRAQRAGFDGVQLAGQGNYLLGQFFSPRMNRRADAYGGSAQNRMRLALEMVEGIRARCGNGFLISYAITADELMPHGLTAPDCVEFARALEHAGLSYLDIRVGTHESFATSRQASGHSRYQSRAGIWEAARVFKEALSIPVFCSSSGCYDPHVWERAVSEGATDVIQLGKPLLADPDLPAKVMAGRVDAIRPCIYCMRCLEIFRAPPERAAELCAVNPVAGIEWKSASGTARYPRTVLIVGAGPAGLETARVAALRGHHVKVLERAAAAGGQLATIGQCAAGSVYTRLRDWLYSACVAAGVEFRFGAAADAASVAAAGADVVVLAHGRVPAPLPACRGNDRPHVMGIEAALAAGPAWGKHVVLIGGGQEAVAIAVTVGVQSPHSHITILEQGRPKELGAGLSQMESAYAAMVEMPGHGIEAYLGVRVLEIRARHVLAVDERYRERLKLPADQVIVALPRVPDPDLPEQLLGLGIKAEIIGDAGAGDTVGAAVRSGADLANRL